MTSDASLRFRDLVGLAVEVGVVDDVVLFVVIAVTVVADDDASRTGVNATDGELLGRRVALIVSYGPELRAGKNLRSNDGRRGQQREASKRGCG